MKAQGLDGGGWLTPRPGRYPVPIVQEAEGASGPVWMGSENLAHTVFRTLDRPARSESLYRPRYPGRPYKSTLFIILL